MSCSFRFLLADCFAVLMPCLPLAIVLDQCRTLGKRFQNTGWSESFLFANTFSSAM